MKLFIKLFAGLIALVIIAVVTLLIVIDPNDYKAQIQSQVKQAINRDLVINGDISWSFYPQLGFAFNDIAVNNPAGFNRENLLKVEDAALGIAVLPLFKGEIQIGELNLNGLFVNLITKQNGRSNLDNMFAEKAAVAKPIQSAQSDAQETQSFNAGKLQLAGINIENVQLEIQDLQTDSLTKVDIAHIHLGKFVPGEATSLSVATNLLVAQMNGHLDLQAKLIVAPDFSFIQVNDLKLQTAFSKEALPDTEINTTIHTDIRYDLATSKAQLTDFALQVDDLKLNGTLSVQTADKTTVRFDLQGNTWNVTPYMAQPAQQKTDATGSEQVQTVSTSEQEPDLSFLNTLDIKGRLSIAGIIADKLKIGAINADLEVAQGKAQIKPLTVQLYEGLLTLNGWVADAQGSNSYNITSTLAEVQVYPLLVDAADINLLSGTTAFNFSAYGKGLTSTRIKSDLVGKGDFTLLDGELYGINIPQEIRVMKAKLTGKPTPTEADIKKTDFASLTGAFNISQGRVDNNKLLMLSPVIRLDGAGVANILTESLDYQLSVTPLSKSDEKTDLQDLSGITIPLLISGPLNKPKFSLDTEGALKAKAKAELERQKQKLQEKSQEELKEKGKELEEKLKSKLNKLFG